MVSFTGGARIGWANASWGLAKLTADDSSLTIRASLLGEHVFAPSEVLAVKAVTWIPVLAWGVQVTHVRSDVAERVIFWTIGPPGRVVRAIADAGFVPSGDPADRPAHAGFPLQPAFVVAAIVLWNGLFLLDRPWNTLGSGRSPWGPGIFSAIALLLVGSLLIRRPGPFQNFALKSPAALARIRPALNIVTLVAALMLTLGAAMAIGLMGP